MSDESPTDTYTASFKTHPGYDASLIVVRGNTVEELVANAQALTNGDTSALQVVVDVQNTLHAINNVSAPDVPAPAQRHDRLGVFTFADDRHGLSRLLCPRPGLAERAESLLSRRSADFSARGPQRAWARQEYLRASSR